MRKKNAEELAGIEGRRCYESMSNLLEVEWESDDDGVRVFPPPSSRVLFGECQSLPPVLWLGDIISTPKTI